MRDARRNHHDGIGGPRDGRARTRPLMRVRPAVVLALALALAAGPALANEPEVNTDPVHWQNRYRALVEKARQLRAKVEVETELYADANRRNYRRGSKRHVHRQAAARAEAKLAKVEAELASMEDEARRAGVPRGWLHQVEIQLEDEARGPAVATGPGDEGRNPLHLESEDGDADERNAGRNPLYLESEGEE